MMFQPHAEYHHLNPMCFGGTLLSDLPAREEPAPVVGGRVISNETDDDRPNAPDKKVVVARGKTYSANRSAEREALYAVMAGEGVVTGEQVAAMVRKSTVNARRALVKLGASGHVKVVIYTRKNVTYEWVAK